jgi:hypothetical protein
MLGKFGGGGYRHLDGRRNVDSFVFPVGARYSSLPRVNVHSFGRFRSMSSENTPWVVEPIRVGAGTRPINASVKVSPALTVRSPISSRTGPV